MKTVSHQFQFSVYPNNQQTGTINISIKPDLYTAEIRKLTLTPSSYSRLQTRSIFNDGLKVRDQ